MSNQPVIVSLEALRTLRQQRYNPLRNFRPEKLVSILENWEIGHLRDGALLFETIADRDDTIKSVKPKREKEVSQLDRQVTALPGSGTRGDEDREILEDFWNTVRTVNAYDRNERGGFRRLVKQMMSATSYRYAAHHIVWRPRAGKLRATFEFVPLWLFENRTGTLRYLSNPWATEGDLLDPSEWMITCGDGLMIACSIGYLAKRSAFNDWLVFSEKFSVPGILGRTSAKKDSPEGQAMRAAVETFGHDWTGVIYGDDGTHEKPIEIIQAAGNPSGMPMPAVVERVDRKFAALYRGADLSSMSSGPSGEGAGASLQGKEKEILLADDAETINETLAEVSRMVIEWHRGRGAEPQAKVELIVPTDEDEKFYLESVTAVKGMGVRVSKDAVLERLGVQEADADEIALGETAPPARLEMTNAMDNEALSEWLNEVRSALAADLQPLGDALAQAMSFGDLPAMQAALRKISADMPSFAGEADALSAVLTEQFTSALLSDTES
jgi:phage gp29-like protein